MLQHRLQAAIATTCCSAAPAAPGDPAGDARQLQRMTAGLCCAALDDDTLAMISLRWELAAGTRIVRWPVDSLSRMLS